MERRYGALRVMGLVYRVVSILILALATLSALGICAGAILGSRLAGELGLLGSEAAGPEVALVGIAFALIVLLFGGLLAVALAAQGELFDLLLKLEENTRTLRRAAEAERQAVAPPPFTPSLIPRPPNALPNPPLGAGAPQPPTSSEQPKR